MLRVCFNYVPSTGIRFVGDVLRCTMGFITIIHHYLGECVFGFFSKHLKQIHVHVCRRIYLHLILGCFSIAKCRVNIPYIDAMDPSQSATLKSKYMANRHKKRSVFSRAQCSTNTSGRSRWAIYFSSSHP